MKSCVGCVNYWVNPRSGRRYCRATDEELYESVSSRYDDQTVKVFHWTRRPTIDAMRAPGGRCGPDAVLYRTPVSLWKEPFALSWQALRKVLGMSYTKPEVK